MNQRAGRVLSAKNENKLRAALQALGEVLAQLESDEEGDRAIRSAGPSVEHRTAAMAGIEIRAADDGRQRIGGYAALFERKSTMLYGFKEKILPGAFADSLGGDIRALWQHDSAQVLGRTTAGTLSLWEDDRGLAFELDPPDTTTGRDALTLIARGDVDQMSFGFNVPNEGDTWSEDEDGIPLRIIKRALLIEVSPVTFPAYTDTSVQVMRSAPEWVQRALAHGVDDINEPDELRARLRRAYRQRYLSIIGG